jgi:hypothetical protein
MKENKTHSVQIRAQQSVAKGNVRKLKEQINGLTEFKVGSLIAAGLRLKTNRAKV